MGGRVGTLITRTVVGVLVAASAVAAAVAGTVYFAVPQYSVQAQQKSDQTVVTPFGRAPLSFADIVERVPIRLSGLFKVQLGD